MAGCDLPPTLYTCCGWPIGKAPGCGPGSMRVRISSHNQGVDMEDSTDANEAIKKVLNILMPPEREIEEMIDDFMPEFIELAADNSTEEEWITYFNKYILRYQKYAPAMSFMLVKALGFTEGYDSIFEELPLDVQEALTSDNLSDMIDEYDL